MEKPEEKEPMRKLFRGSDKGNAFVQALTLILVLSSIFVSLAPRIITIKQFAQEYKEKVIHEIEQSNREIRNNYDNN